MRRWARAIVGDSDEADDVAQEAVIVVYRKIEQFRGDSSFSGWLYRITARLAGQRRRRFARRVALARSASHTDAPTVYTTDPGGRVDASRLALRVEELYDALPAAQRAAMGLVDLDGYTPAQAAEMMAVAPGTLRVNLSKARASVRRRLLAQIPELVVAAESAMAAAWTAPRGSIDVGALVSRRRRRWLGRGAGVLFWGCAVPFGVVVLLATVYGLGMLAFVWWIAP